MTYLKIAHRGACAYAPENTLLSLRKGFELGADALECDVHLCKSGEPVVIHDETLSRTTNGKGKVREHTLAQLKTLDAGQGETIPTLAEYLDALGKHTIFIEIKTAEAALAVAGLVHRYVERGILQYEQMIVISFDWQSLLQVKAFDPEILISASPRTKQASDGFIRKAKDAGMIGINPDIRHLTKPTVQLAHKHGLQVFTWTANSKADIAKAQKLGVDGIMSDFPDRL